MQFVRYRVITIAFGLTALYLVVSVPSGIAQKSADRWLRVITEESMVIDVDRTSLVIEPNQIIKATFKTTLSHPEPMAGKSEPKYKTRLDTIQFNLTNSQYRIFESTLNDASGSVISQSSGAGHSWKAYRGTTKSRLLSAAGQLFPFGTWRVLSYRYAAGDPPSADDPSELTSLVGSNILLSRGMVYIGKEQCSSPVFEPKTITNDDFLKKTGSPLTSLGIAAEKVEVLIIKCGIRDKFPLPTFLLLSPGGKTQMLWDGVFLEIERPRQSFNP